MLLDFISKEKFQHAIFSRYSMTLHEKGGVWRAPTTPLTLEHQREKNEMQTGTYQLFMLYR